MSDTFDYAQVPHGFIHCLQAECPKAATCLRQMAYAHLPEQEKFLHVINPKQQLPRKGACPYYLDAQPVRYARGFMRTINALPVGKLETFRIRLISRFSQKIYYLTRKGERALSPEEQETVISIARQLGLQLDDYFDKYEYRLHW